LAVVALARGAYVEVVEHCLAHDAVGAVRHGFFGLAALACAYAGDVERARELNGRWTAVASAPSHRAWAAYYDGEIENTAGRRGRAEQHYLRAVALGRSSGDTFVVAVATVGLLSVLPRDGRHSRRLRRDARIWPEPRMSARAGVVAAGRVGSEGEDRS
jgi:hypothetical protein